MKIFVRDAHGVPLLCTWDDCGQYGDDRHQVIYGPNKVRYIFCSRGHREFWEHSHRDNGNKPGGSRTRPGIIVR